MELTDIQQRFVIHWGEMGSAWGVNRTVAQIHALLFIHGRPLHAEELAATLGVARSNVSNSLKELHIHHIIIFEQALTNTEVVFFYFFLCLLYVFGDDRVF